jgi:hypothetical protein
MPFAVLDRLIYHFAYLGEEPLVMFQLVEYLVSYTIGRIGFSSVNALMILSGAFTMFDRKLLLEGAHAGKGLEATAGRERPASSVGQIASGWPRAQQWLP